MVLVNTAAVFLGGVVLDSLSTEAFQDENGLSASFRVAYLQFALASLPMTMDTL